MAATPEKVTEEQANAALQQLTGVDADGAEIAAEPTTETQTVEEPPVQEADASTADTEAEAQTAEPAEVEAAETDDVQSLKKRLETIETERKRDREQNEERLRAIQERHAANERILRDRHLRKSSIADKALRTLRAVRTEAGVPEAEVDRIIAELQGTMNPDSASYAPPPEPQQLASEDQIVTLNSFLNEKGMTGGEAEEFGKWMRGEAGTALTPQEQAVAVQSLDGFLRLAHTRWQDGLRETNASNQKRQVDAAAVVKAAQRTQRAAARAATTPSASPKKPPTVSKPIDLKKLSKNDISELMKRSVEEAEAGNY